MSFLDPTPVAREISNYNSGSFEGDPVAQRIAEQNNFGFNSEAPQRMGNSPMGAMGDFSFLGGVKDLGMMGLGKLGGFLGERYGAQNELASKALGKGSPLIADAAALFNIYSGFKGMKRADKQYDQQVKAWQQTWDANKTNFNASVDNRAGLKYSDQSKRDEYKKQFSLS